METPLPVNSRPRVARSLITVATGLIAIVIIGLGFWWITPRFTQKMPSTDSTPVAGLALEERWGIRVKQVGVTAEGGLVDLRYTVIDPDKAARMFEDLATVPLITTADGTRIQLTSKVKHHQQFETGRTYYILYKNPRDAVRAGSIVSVLVGDARVDGIVAR